MSKLFFLSTSIIYSLIVLLFLSLIFLPFWLFFILIMFVGQVLFFFRRSQIPFQDTQRLNHEIFLSPVFGRIISIRQNVSLYADTNIAHEIRIAMPLWSGKGLYLPTSGEVSYMKASQGNKIPRNAEPHLFYGPLADIAHTDFNLTSTRGISSLLRFIDSPYGKRPIIWLKSGDRGRAASCFGYYPFGGTLLIYLPQNSDILVYVNEWIMPGKTVIASVKDRRL